MKSIITLLFAIGLFLIISTYYKENAQCPAPKIEYRYVQRPMIDEQLSEHNLNDVFGTMFQKGSAWQTYPSRENTFAT